MLKAKERYSKGKAAEHCLQNKEAIKEKLKNWYINLSEEEKDKIKEYQRQREISATDSVQKKKSLQNKWVLFLLSIKMSKKTKIWQYWA